MVFIVPFLALAGPPQVSEDTRRHFMQAVGKGDLTEVKSALKQHPELKNARTRQGATAVQYAYYTGQEKVAKALLAVKPEIDLPTAVTAGLQTKVVALLKRNPALANTMSKDGFTPLCLAVAFGHASIARTLLAHGADVNKRSDELGKVAPIHSAVFGRNLECVRLILDHHADVNMTQQDGFTALHEAAQNGDAAIIKLLLERGANRSMKTSDGKTALDLARAGKHEAAVRLLES